MPSRGTSGAHHIENEGINNSPRLRLLASRLSMRRPLTRGNESQDEFVKLKGADAAPAAAWVPGQPSPYENPVRPMRIEWIRPGEELRTTLEGFRREDFAGHFAKRAMCPVSILGGNACTLLRHFPGFDAYQITRCVLTCKQASLPGERLQLHCVREQADHFMVTAHNDQGKLLSTFHMDARAHSL